MRHELLTILFNFVCLIHSLNHDFILLIIIEIIIAIVSNSFQHEAVAWSKSDVNAVVGHSVGDEVVDVHLAMEALDVRPNHFSNLIVEEGLPFQEVVDEFQSSGVFAGGDLERVLIYIHVIICS